MKVRFVGREYSVGRAQGRSYFSWSDSFCWSRDGLRGIEQWAWKRLRLTLWTRTTRLQSTRKRWWTRCRSASNADPESWKRHWHCVAITTSAGRSTSSRSELGGTHLAGILVNMLGFERCQTAPQFHWRAVRLVALELHMDEIHGAAPPSGRK